MEREITELPPALFLSSKKELFFLNETNLCLGICLGDEAGWGAKINAAARRPR
jgi:hypothetical protein